MDVHRVIGLWRETADKDLDVAQNLFRLKHYAYCLFFCHLVIEKLLKALVVQETGKHAPTIHELEKLAKLANLKLTAAQQKHLAMMTTFNIQARYDDVKQSFYKRATREFAREYLTITKGFSKWLKGNLH